jgi:hypothetical protein
LVLLLLQEFKRAFQNPDPSQNRQAFQNKAVSIGLVVACVQAESPVGPSGTVVVPVLRRGRARRGKNVLGSVLNELFESFGTLCLKGVPNMVVVFIAPVVIRCLCDRSGAEHRWKIQHHLRNAPGKIGIFFPRQMNGRFVMAEVNASIQIFPEHNRILFQLIAHKRGRVAAASELSGGTFVSSKVVHDMLGFSSLRMTGKGHVGFRVPVEATIVLPTQCKEFFLAWTKNLVNYEDEDERDRERVR